MVSLFRTEQELLRLRQELEVESDECNKYQKINEINHTINELTIFKNLKDGWPDHEIIGDRKNRASCIVLQHCDQKV